jgi:hypothetical protein
MYIVLVIPTRVEGVPHVDEVEQWGTVASTALQAA